MYNFVYINNVHTVGNEVPIINTVSRNSRLPTNEGYVYSSIYCNFLLDTVCMVVIRQKVESLILSSQISTDLQRRVFLGGETIQLTFSIGMV